MIEKDKEPKQHQRIPRWLNFVIGGTSASMAVCIVQPMDLLKTRMQLVGLSGQKTKTLEVARGIIAKEGYRGFYVGISAALFRQITYGSGRLGCFNGLMDTYKSTYGVPPGYGTKLGIGMFSGGVGGVLGTPAEVALIRMTADGRLPFDKRRNYRHVFDALARITREEGALTMWRGCAATVTRSSTVNGVVLGTYAQARQLLLPALGDGIVLHFCSSMIAGFVTTFVSLPVDIVKTRVQNAEAGTSQISVFKSLIKNEGFFSLFSGFWPAYGKIGPHAVFTFIFLEQLNALYYRMTEGTAPPSSLKP